MSSLPVVWLQRDALEKNKRKLVMQLTDLSKILVLFLFSSGMAFAIGLGDIAVRSYLNEPLKAEIPLRVDSATEVEDLRLSLASPAQFDRFGIVRSRIHDGLGFEISPRGRDWVIRVSSREAVREPYLAFPLKALWRDGEMIREYTVFIDPRPAPRAPTIESPPVRTSDTGSPPARPRAAPPPVPSATPPTALAPGERYGPVQRGETLWPIAQRLRPPGVSTEQMMMALLSANPKAFGNANVNDLKAGAILEIPTLEAISGRTPREARREYREQTAAWRGKVSAPRETTAPVSEALESPTVPPDEEDAEIRILGKASEASAATARQASVEASAEVEKKLLLTLESAEATRLEFAALRDQVNQMQEQMTQLRELLLLRERQIAAMQAEQKASARPRAAVVEPTKPPLARPEPRPIAVEGPVRTPVDSAKDFLLQWWFVLLAALLAMLGILLGLLLARRVDGGAPKRSAAVQATQSSPQARPYAAEVARYGAAGAAALPQPAEKPTATEPAPRDAMPRARAQAPTPAPAASGPPPPDVTASLDSALPDSALEVADLGIGTNDGGVSDDEIESWVRDLQSELDDEEGDAHRNQARMAGLVNEPGDIDLDIQLDADALDDLEGPDEESKLEAVSVMQELLIDPESGLRDDAEIDALGRDESDSDPEAVDLKLELARAYLEIGDIEGAREILGEVVDGAMSSEQKEEAKLLLETLR